MYFDTDKIYPHQYFQFYAQVAGILGPAARVCELGVDKGESLRMWQSLFPLGEITGVDAHEGCTWPEGTRKIIADHADENLPGILGGSFDLIVDDGSHLGEMVDRSFRNLWPAVKPGGFYVVEDWMIALRASDRPGETWGYKRDKGILRAVQRFTELLTYPDSECEQVTYRYGLAAVRKRSSE